MSRKPGSPVKLSRKQHKNRLLLVTSLIIVLSASFATYYFIHIDETAGSAQLKSASSNSYFLIKSGSSITVFDGAFRYVPFNISTSSTISGEFNASEGITMYIVFSSDATSIDSHGVPYSYVFTSGHVSSETFSTNLKPGSYDLMLANDNGYNSPSVVTFTVGVMISS